MNVLFIAPRLPLPADTGAKIRTYNILKQLSRIHQVELLCFSFDPNDWTLAESFKEYNIRVHMVPNDDPTVLEKGMLALFDKMALSAGKYLTEEMCAKVSDLSSKKTYDIIHIDHVHMAHYRKYFPNTPAVLDEHNVEYRILERCAGVEHSSIKRKLLEQQAAKMKGFEKSMVKTFQRILAVSDEDKRTLQRLVMAEVPVDVVPNGVDTDFFQPQHEPQVEEALVFTGSMDWMPNDDAMVYFIDKILPRIWKMRGQIKVYIVGKSPSKQLQHISEDESRVEVTGRVDDVRTYIDRSKVFIVPIRIGGGTRLKILEAMSMKKPVVSTSVGAEGIDYTEGLNISIADSPDAFADKVILLMEDMDRRMAMGEEGRKLVCGKYDWNVVGERLKNAYEEVRHDGIRKG